MSKGVRVIRYIIIGLVVLLLLGLALLRVGWGLQGRGARLVERRGIERRGTWAYADIDL